MKKIRLTFLMLMAFMMSLAAFGQSTLTVNDGEATSEQIPLDGYNADSDQQNQWLYPASDLADMNGKAIKQMVFYFNSSYGSYSSSVETGRLGTWTVSLGETTATTLSALDNETTTTQVYSGIMTWNHTDLTLTVTFDQDYIYNGGNLLVEFNHAEASWNRYYFLGVETTDEMSYNSYNEEAYAFLPKTTFTYQVPASCAKPSGLNYSGITANSAILSWTANNGETEWTLEVNGTEIANITENPYTLPNLTPSTDYTVKVKAHCSATETSEWSSTISFSTLCEAITTLPWTENFESFTASTVPDCWDNSASTSSTIISNPEYIWGVYSYNDNQMIRMYNYYVQSGVALINSKPVTLPTNEVYVLTFNYSHLASCGAFSVKISNDGGSTFVEKGSYTATSTSYNYNNPGTFTETMPISLAEYAGQTIIIQFYANANYGSGAIFIDDVNIDPAPACMTPNGLAVADITSSSALISWNDQNVTAPQGWTLEVNGTETAVITENPYTLPNLTPATDYTVKVKANCSATDMSDWSTTISFTTACEAVASIDEDFEDYTSGLPTCWEKVGSGTIAVQTSQPNSGTKSLRFSGVTGGNIVALPAVESYDGMYLTFFTKPEGNTYSSCGSFAVGYITNIADASTFTAIETYNYDDADFAAYAEKSIDLSTVPANARIAFNHMAGATYYYWFVDDVTLAVPPTCLKPTDVTISNITTTSATIAWTDNNATAPQSWVIDLNGTEYEATTNPFTIETLTASTNYTVKVKAICTDEDESDYSNETAFATECDVVAADGYVEAFESYTATSLSTQGVLPTCWESIFTGSTSGYAPHVSSAGTFMSMDGNFLALVAGGSSAGAENYAIMPEFITLDGMTISFNYRYENETTGNLCFGYITDIADATTFVVIDSLTPTTTITGAEYELADIPTAARLAFKWASTSTTWYSCGIDTIAITGDEPVVEPCDAPTNVTYENGVVTWTGDAANYNVHIVAGETTIDTTVSAATYTIEGLNNGDHATVTVQAICDEENLSDWSEAVEFDYIIDGINSYAIQANIFPNPTTGNVTVESNAIGADLTVFDMFGKLMMTAKVAAERTELNFSSFAPGVYMVRIANSNAITTVKVVKE